MNESVDAILCYGIPLTTDEVFDIEKWFNRLSGFKPTVPGFDDDGNYTGINLDYINHLCNWTGLPEVTKVDRSVLAQVVTGVGLRTGVPTVAATTDDELFDQLVNLLSHNLGGADRYRRMLRKPPQDVLDQYNREADAKLKSLQLPFEVVYHCNSEYPPMCILAAG